MMSEAWMENVVNPTTASMEREKALPRPRVAAALDAVQADLGPRGQR